MVQMGLNDNFLVGYLGVTPDERGILEAFRESCGILALGILALLAGLAEPLIASAMLVIFGVGLAGYAGVHTFTGLVLVSLIWSQGLHVWMPLPNSMMLSLAEPGQTGRRMGQMQGAGAIGSALGLFVSLILAWCHVSLRPMYVMAGAVAAIGAVVCLGIPRNIKTPGPRLVVRRRYWRYYLLSFLEGWRKQIAIAFASYLLVMVYGTPVQTMLLLWLGVQVFGWLASPHVGRIIDRIGERPVLMFYYATLVVFFLGYAFLRDKYLLYGVFVLDNAFFILAMALTTYVRHIAPPSEHTSTLSMGVAMNHVAAVTMPLVGGYVWAHANYQWTFMIGIFAVLMSIGAAMSLPQRKELLAAAVSREEPAKIA